MQGPKLVQLGNGKIARVPDGWQDGVLTGLGGRMGQIRSIPVACRSDLTAAGDARGASAGGPAQQMKQVAMIPAGAELLPVDAALAGRVALEQIQRQTP